VSPKIDHYDWYRQMGVFVMLLCIVFTRTKEKLNYFILILWPLIPKVSILKINAQIWLSYMKKKKTIALQMKGNRLRYLNLPSLQYRRRRGDLLLLYQMINSYYDIDFRIFFSLSTTMTRGHNMKLQRPHVNSLCRSSFFQLEY